MDNIADKIVEAEVELEEASAYGLPEERLESLLKLAQLQRRLHAQFVKPTHNAYASYAEFLAKQE